MATKVAHPRVDFETHPSRYQHLKLAVDGPVAHIVINIKEDGGLRPDYALKLNSYDLGVDIELADAVERLRFEHPEVAAVVIASGQEGTFSAGANIFMLRTSTHGFKVNFCKFTNETRLAIEDAATHSGQTYLAAINGVASGGGYELALACQEIYLVDDRKSAVALPEVPYLGVLPGTGGLTRVVDKRKVRRDRADWFCTVAEGLKGKRAKEWGFVDDVFPSSRFTELVEARARAVAGKGHPERKGVALEPLKPEVSEKLIRYRHVELSFGPIPRTATLTVEAPTELPEVSAHLQASWYPLRAFRELDDALLRLRFNHSDVGLVILRTRGDAALLRKLDEQLASHPNTWFVREVTLHMKRVLKRLDVSSKSTFALIDQGSCFVGSLLELALAADRAYMLHDDAVAVQLTELNAGPLSMANGLTRLATRLLAEPAKAAQTVSQREPLRAEAAVLAGLATVAVDPLDWDDEIRVAIEERASLSPDALTGMESNLRFAGPETLETKIFGRLSAWQNWIFQRPNAVGEHGALTLYGEPERPEFEWERT